MSASWVSQSMILPLPSSPHANPSIETTLIFFVLVTCLAKKIITRESYYFCEGLINFLNRMVGKFMGMFYTRIFCSQSVSALLVFLVDFELFVQGKTFACVTPCHCFNFLISVSMFGKRN